MTLIPVCIWGFARSPYAYGDIAVTNHMHTGNISKYCIPICVNSYIGIAGCIWGSLHVKQAWIAKKFAYGDPRMHNKVVCLSG